MNVELWPIENIKPYGKNPRVNDGAVDAVARSIQEFGFRQPIVVDGKGVIIAGHTRWKAAQKLELKQVPVHVADNLTAAQVRAYRIADNKVAELAEWDMATLPEELQWLDENGFDLANMGFSQQEIEQLVGKGMDFSPQDDDFPDINPTESHTVILRYRDADIVLIRKFVNEDIDLMSGKAGRKILERIKAIASSGAA